jgi:general secretion pathway protein G
MVVIVIIGSLVALVGPNVFKAIFTSSVKTAETQMSNFESAIKMYYADKRKMPESLEELAEQDESGNAYLDSIPKDPWDREYSYRRLEKNKYIIRCLGEDGAEGTEDDIVRPPEAKE